MRAQPKHYELKLHDVTLVVHEWEGQGDPILMLHATGFHSRCWDQIIMRLPNAHIYAVDLRFHGASGAHGNVDWQLMARDIEQLIDSLDLQRVLGVGHSLGGHLAARVAAERIERFRALVLIDPVILPRDRYDTAPELANMTADMHPVSRRKNQWRDSDEMFERFEKISLVGPYIHEKKEAINQMNESHKIDGTSIVNGRRQTNVGIFRAYLLAYLKQNENE